MVDATFNPTSFTTPPAGVMSVSSVAGEAAQVVTNIMRVEPMLAGMAGMFVPGLSLVQPWIVMMAPYLERALTDLSQGNNGDVLGAFIELIQHITKGQPNSLTLTPAASQQSDATNSSSFGG